MINFDNSATSFPKPPCVLDAIYSSLKIYGGNPGRSGHKLSLSTADKVFSARSNIADFFSAEVDNVVFTSNCTHALNIAIKGILKKYESSHVIISELEHNSVARPLFCDPRVSYSIAKIHPKDSDTLAEIKRLITPKTKAIIMTAGSNVSGQILPFREIAKLCKIHNLCYIVDAAQIAGVYEISLSDGINIICTAGHKSLYGPFGTGLLITDGKYEISPLMEGGSGSTSLELTQPEFMPDRLEAGTLNVMGILGLDAGVSFVKSVGMENILAHENLLCDYFISELSSCKEFRFYRKEFANYLPIVSFNLSLATANEVAENLSEEGFCLRGGLHCSGLAHKSLGTAPQGTVRFSPSYFNTLEETKSLVLAIKKMAILL